MTDVGVTPLQRWADALAATVCASAPPGGPVFVDLDVEAIDKVRDRYKLADIVSTVKDEAWDGRHWTDVLLEARADGAPPGLPFLVLMAEAARRMERDNKIDERAYFARLREVLDLPKSVERAGLDDHLDAKMWESWNVWLEGRGYQPTAFQGSAAHKFTDLPISQILLRNSDRDSLAPRFGQVKGKIHHDEDVVPALLATEATLRKHIRSILSGDSARFEAASEALIDAFRSWELGGGSPNRPRWSLGLAWDPGDYRRDPGVRLIARGRTGQWPASRPALVSEDEEFPLEPGLGFWSQPLVDLDVFADDLTGSYRWTINDELGEQAVGLVRRPVWALVDVEDEHPLLPRGTWRRPGIGDVFDLLIDEPHLEYLDALIDGNFLVSEGRASLDGGWYRVSDAQYADSLGWEGLVISNPLAPYLRPVEAVSLRLRGGLRHPASRAFMEGYLPELTPVSFSPVVLVDIVDLPTKRLTKLGERPANQPIPLADFQSKLVAGRYRVAVHASGQTRHMSLSVCSWEELHRA